MIYKSSFKDWYSRASIRSKPRRLLREQLDLGLYCFPPELAPVCGHALLADCDPEVIREGLMQHLFSYLTFTDRLEHEVVNQMVRHVGTGAMGLQIPPEMRIDAHKIYCDEAYHSLFSIDLMFQVQTVSDFVFKDGGGHPALEYFHSRVEGAPPDSRAWVELFFVIVSETLISGVLSKIPNSPQVITAVRQLVADHAEDEGRHHSFFARLCEIAWPQLPRRLQCEIGVALPNFIMNFLMPDYAAIRVFLAKYLRHDEVEEVIGDCYTPARLLENARTAAQATLRIFERSGILNDAQITEAFHKNGFLL